MRVLVRARPPPGTGRKSLELDHEYVKSDLLARWLELPLERIIGGRLRLSSQGREGEQISIVSVAL